MICSPKAARHSKITMRFLVITAAFLVVMAWRYRNNRPVFFVVVGSIFAVAALLVSVSNLPERIVESLALAWAACMLVAGVFAAGELAKYLRKKRNAVPHDPKNTR
jgi:putative Ca2+/H+ antiporter (TMEM165/GDT1 family)